MISSKAYLSIGFGGHRDIGWYIRQGVFSSFQESTDLLLYLKSSEVYKMAVKKAEVLRVEESFLNLGGGKRLKVSL